MKLTDVYKGILESLGLFVDDNGYIKLEMMPDEYIPVSIDNKNLVLPTKEILENPNWNTTMAFHPLSENIARKDSPVFKKLQGFVNISLNSELSYILGHLVEVCSDKDRHKTMNHKQVGFLALYPNADETSFKNWDKITSKLNDVNTLVKVVTLRNKNLNGEVYPRVSFVKFPFYEELVKQTESKQKEYNIYGVKLRKKDVEGFKALFEFIIDDVNNPDVYSAGSRNNIAPSFHALMLAYVSVKKMVSRTFNLLKLDTFSLHWVEALNDLSKFKGHIPPLEGNEGDIIEGEKRKMQTTILPNSSNVGVSTPTPQVNPVQPLVSAPVVQPQPTTLQPAVPIRHGDSSTASWMPSNSVKPVSPPTPVQQSVLPSPQPQAMVSQPMLGVNPAVNPAMINPMMYGAMGMVPQVRYNDKGQAIDQNGRPITGYQTAAQYAMQTNPMAMQQMMVNQMMQGGYQQPMMGMMTPAMPMMGYR